MPVQFFAFAIAIGSPGVDWQETAIPDAQLAQISGGALRPGQLGRMGAEQLLPQMQSMSQDLRTGFDNWFADRTDLRIADAVRFGR